MNEQKQIEIEADRILRLFSNSGAKIVQPTILQQADTLLDLYGEDIRHVRMLQVIPLMAR